MFGLAPVLEILLAAVSSISFRLAYPEVSALQGLEEGGKGLSWVY